MLALGLFADGHFGDGYNGVAGTVRGLFYGGGASQLVCQLTAVGACIVWTLLVGGLAFAILDRILGSNRVNPDVELAGLDIPEMGSPGYPEFISHIAPESTLTMPSAASRRLG
jgi:Amt family ammonium transporter